MKFPVTDRSASPFRVFLRNMWEEHRDEVLAWTNKPVTYTSEQFFRKNKWYLKTLYRKLQQNSTE
jgi:hypothetical protein